MKLYGIPVGNLWKTPETKWSLFPENQRENSKISSLNSKRQEVRTLIAPGKYNGFNNEENLKERKSFIKFIVDILPKNTIFNFSSELLWTSFDTLPHCRKKQWKTLFGNKDQF